MTRQLTGRRAGVTESDIVDLLLDYIADGDPSERGFNEAALSLFSYQYERNDPFRRFAQQRGRTPRTVRSWREIPPVPISVFKDLTLSCRAPEDDWCVFMTSGTTRDGVRGRSYHPTLAVYDASFRANFGDRFMRGNGRMRMAILFPDEAAMPNSSLAHYLALAVGYFGTDDSRWFVGPDGLDADGLCATLEKAVEENEPIAVLGASYSFVHLFDAIGGRRFVLPEGSRILDTGGFKGQSREMGAEAFYARLGETFGVPLDRCINMYGMTELSTQFYDDGNAVQPPVKSGPHWIRSRVIDPLTGEDVRDGEVGVLSHCDLAHFNPACCILTEDAGVVTEAGFYLLGRADGADAQGCSLSVEEFLRAAEGAAG
jgi:hypothetical protein